MMAVHKKVDGFKTTQSQKKFSVNNYESVKFFFTVRLGKTRLKETFSAF
jgi:hypothetical protein